MHGWSAQVIDDDDHPHVELMHRAKERPSYLENDLRCSDWCLENCRTCMCNHQVAWSTRMLSWISGFVFYAAGQYPGGRFNRFVYDGLIQKLLSAGVVNRNYSNGVKINVMEVRINDHLSVLLFERGEEEDAAASKKPIFMFIHGGGFTIGNPYEKMFYDFCKNFAAQGFLMVSPIYRLAPEHPFPTPVSDCFDALKFIADANVAELRNGDKNRVLIGGDSVGGNMSLVLGTLYRDRLNVDLQREDLTSKIRLCQLVLLYPTLLLPFPTKSAIELKNAVLLPHWLSRWFLESYLPDPVTRQRILENDRRVCPLHAGVHELPKTILISATHDPFRDECKVLCKELLAAGTQIIHHEYENVPHGFGTIFNQTARHCQRQILDDLLQDPSIALKQQPIQQQIDKKLV